MAPVAVPQGVPGERSEGSAVRTAQRVFPGPNPARDITGPPQLDGVAAGPGKIVRTAVPWSALPPGERRGYPAHAW